MLEGQHRITYPSRVSEVTHVLYRCLHELSDAEEVVERLVAG